MNGTSERAGPPADDVDLKGLRVLVVEDEFILALSIERALADAGCEVVGPVGRVSEAAQAAQDCPLDGAILDVHLHGETVSPVADRLVRSGVPVLFTTAAAERDLPPELRRLPRLRKPVDLHRLLAAATRAFRPRRPQFA